MKKQVFTKMRRGWGTSGKILIIPTSESQGCQRRRGRANNWKLIWTNNKGELPQSGKANRLPGSPGSSESPKEVGPKEAHTEAHHTYVTQDETEGENLKSSKRKGHSYLQRSSHKTVRWFLKRNLAGKKGLERSIPSHERQGPTSKMTLSSKAII